MARVMNLQKTSEGSCGSSFSGQLPAEVEIQVKEGGTGLHETIREINLVYKGLNSYRHLVILLKRCWPQYIY